jgi:hypothetical protein
MYQNETFKKFLVLGLICLSTQFAFAQNQQQPETAEDAITAIEGVQEGLTSLKYFAERIDLGRILVLEKRLQTTAQLLKSPQYGLGNMVTLNSYIEMVDYFDNSKAFLKSISTKMSEGWVTAVQQRIQAIKKARGFDKSPVSQKVASVLGQVHNLTQQIQTQQVSENLVRWMKQVLDRKLGEAKAAAVANGDVPSSFERGNEIYALIASQYGELYQINPKNPAYNMVTELMGLMEYYKDLSTKGSSVKGNN